MAAINDALVRTFGRDSLDHERYHYAGLFLDRLGRDRVCGLKRDDVEIPSDFVGVVMYLSTPPLLGNKPSARNLMSRRLKSTGTG